MTCPQCKAIEDVFDRRNAEKELKAYRKKGPQKVERILIDAIRAPGVEGWSVLDIGGGIGAVQIALLEAGAQKSTSVEASHSYIACSQEEFIRRGLSERVSYLHGDFVDLAGQLEQADVVTLVRSLCCYPDFEALVRLSAERARFVYGLVYPRDSWWLRSAFRLAQPLFQLSSRTSFRIFVHPTEKVEQILRDRGLNRRFYATSGIWQVVVFGR